MNTQTHNHTRPHEWTHTRARCTYIYEYVGLHIFTLWRIGECNAHNFINMERCKSQNFRVCKHVQGNILLTFKWRGVLLYFIIHIMYLCMYVCTWINIYFILKRSRAWLQTLISKYIFMYVWINTKLTHTHTKQC